MLTWDEYNAMDSASRVALDDETQVQMIVKDFGLSEELVRSPAFDRTYVLLSESDRRAYLAQRDLLGKSPAANTVVTSALNAAARRAASIARGYDPKIQLDRTAPLPAPALGTQARQLLANIREIISFGVDSPSDQEEGLKLVDELRTVIILIEQKANP